MSVRKLLGVLAILAATAAPANPRTLRGEYFWNIGVRSGPVEAVFTPAGESRWDVTFRFEFRGNDHVYTGNAEGSLEAGELKGRVRNEDKTRTFTFRGKFEDGAFKGTHAEVTEGEEQATGTLTLGR